MIGSVLLLLVSIPGPGIETIELGDYRQPGLARIGFPAGAKLTGEKWARTWEYDGPDLHATLLCPDIETDDDPVAREARRVAVSAPVLRMQSEYLLDGAGAVDRQLPGGGTISLVHVRFSETSGAFIEYSRAPVPFSRIFLAKTAEGLAIVRTALGIASMRTANGGREPIWPGGIPTEWQYTFGNGRKTFVWPSRNSGTAAQREFLQPSPPGGSAVRMELPPADADPDELATRPQPDGYGFPAGTRVIATGTIPSEGGPLLKQVLRSGSGKGEKEWVSITGFRATGARDVFLLSKPVHDAWPTIYGSLRPDLTMDPLVPGAFGSVKIARRRTIVGPGGATIFLPTERNPVRTGDRIDFSVKDDAEQTVAFVGAEATRVGDLARFTGNPATCPLIDRLGDKLIGYVRADTAGGGRLTQFLVQSPELVVMSIWDSLANDRLVVQRTRMGRDEAERTEATEWFRNVLDGTGKPIVPEGPFRRSTTFPAASVTLRTPFEIVLKGNAWNHWVSEPFRVMSSLTPVEVLEGKKRAVALIVEVAGSGRTLTALASHTHQLVGGGMSTRGKPRTGEGRINGEPADLLISEHGGKRLVTYTNRKGPRNGQVHLLMDKNIDEKAWRKVLEE